ncbi:MAG: dephospho-CoA kinase [Acutalibacteraceae bacterium]|nr:dephospho-CoA kinase [Acutalibacteraceae bacterium]
MSFVIGLTGPTGAGKSSVTDTAEELGFKIIDCDLLARDAVRKGSDGLADVVKVFGECVLNTDGTLNRKKLAEIAFASPQDTELLNQTLLPHIVKLIRAQIDSPYVLLDAPTLFESGADSLCDEVIVVLSDKKMRKARIMERDVIDEQAAELRINAGKDDDFYIQRTNNIVYNDCELSVLKLKIKKLLNKIMEEHNNV